MNFLSNILSGFNKSKSSGFSTEKPNPEMYEKERTLARSKSSKDRLRLAENPKTHLEILYYLAEDQDDKVRRAVASNPSTPMQISDNLAQDDNVDVKIALIKRLAGLLPDLSQDQYAHLYAFAAQALGVLALDEVLKVRLALSSALKDELYAPPEVAAQLARDLERQVSEPILKLCTAVPDDVLIDILVQHPEDWVIETIASRQDLCEGVSEAVIKTNNLLAGRMLIENTTAKMSDDLIDDILRVAPEKPEWHKPLALQTHLPSRVIRKIIMFVDSSIQKLIFERTDMDEETRNELMDTVSRRVNFLVDEKGKRVTPVEKAKKLMDDNKLDDNAVRDALAIREYEFVYSSLSLKSKISVDIVKKMIETGSAKATTAIVWMSGFEMRTSLEIQKTIAKIQPREMLYPKNGDQFPLSEEDMKWQIDFFND